MLHKTFLSIPQMFQGHRVALTLNCYKLFVVLVPPGVWCLPPVWNLRAVIWFHFAISSLVLLPSPVTLSVLPFSACWPFLLNFSQKILRYFSLRDGLFCMAPVWRLGEDSWSVVCAACCHVTLVFAVMHLYNILEFFIASVHSFF